MTGIIATKIGMTRIFQDDGKVTPVTVLECKPNKIAHIKTTEKDGYEALVLGIEKTKGATKTKKYSVMKEFPLGDGEYKKGDSVTTQVFEGIEKVAVCGISKGKGFQGVIKRHNFARGPETHGSHHHREPGSIGACAKPGRVHKGKKMAGHMGTDKVTKKNVPIAHIDHEKNLICVKGPVPGANGSIVFLNA